MKCLRKNCNNEAKYIPLVRLFPPAPYEQVASIDMEFGLPTCEECAKVVKLHDVAPPMSLNILANSIEELGLVRPDIERTRLAWLPISKAKVDLEEAIRDDQNSGGENPPTNNMVN